MVAPCILPYIVNRPLLLLRCPSGQPNCFYQKHHIKAFSNVIEPILIPNDSNPYCVIKNLSGLLELVQFNTLEIHVWNSTTDNLLKPDKIIFDLDPGPGVDWNLLKQCAFIIRKELTKLNLISFIKLSGKKGLHIIIPLTPEENYGTVKAYSKSIAYYLTGKYPNYFTATVRKSQRNHKVFVDYLRNGEGATTVAAYSTRAMQNAPISLPISWPMLKKINSSHQYAAGDILKNRSILKQSISAWKHFYTCEQSLSKLPNYRGRK